MPAYIVAYDLRTPGKDYTNLIKALESFPHCKPQQSLWLIESAYGAIAIRDALSKHLDYNDTIMVSEVSRSWAGRGMPKCGAWLNAKGY
ncbi:hypothetical protein ACNKFW_15420 (plasmid) [Paracoccus sp. TD-10]|uniref:hypothetical protein n=1 Tax=Paracoccus sp. TD-10 TaxID=3395918 RepID=UPI003AACA706